MDYAPLLALLRQWQARAAQLQIRLPVVWQGEPAELLSNTFQLLDSRPAQTLYWIGADAPDNAVKLSQQSNYQLLGSECDMLVINAFSGFPADLVAASAGCVKAGGLWLLLCPPFDSWQLQPNSAHKGLLPYPLTAETHHGQFISFWLAKLQRQNIVTLLADQVQQQLQWPAPPAMLKVNSPYRTAEQQAAVEAIVHVASGHRRRPLVITADRGRGKSAALGLAAAHLAAKGKRILITAPSPQAAQTALDHFQLHSGKTQHNQLQFMPFDELLRSNITTDLLLIDEAAAIPTPVLQQLLQRFSRTVFATTEHGYEGTGRGFQLRFQQHLTEHCPGWKKLYLQQPVRYQVDDPAEQLVFATFLLQQTIYTAAYDPNTAVVFASYHLNDWLANGQLLQQVFSLLSLAHYQTQVKDLAALLDNPHLKVVTLQQHDRLLACALISIEGNIPLPLTTQIYHAERRVQGHLLAQSLAFHLAQPELANMCLWRVMRIAVHPNLQRQGIGTILLQHINHLAKEGEAAFLGTSFGSTLALLQFWQQAGYRPVRLGSSMDKASAEYSVLMLKGITAPDEIAAGLQQQFSWQLYYNFAQYPLLDTTLALHLTIPPLRTQLTTIELQQLRLFSQAKRPFELISHLLLHWFNQHSDQLPDELSRMLCALLWQRKDWPTLLQQFSFTSRKAFLAHIAKSLQQIDELIY
jgi:tRNA(Met) cytidine acetyltransferase